MSGTRPVLRLFLDESVPRSVGEAFARAGHEVQYLQETMPTGSPDPLVCAVAERNDAVLVAIDGDMRRLAQRRGIGKRSYRSLSLIKLSCRETMAAKRVSAAMSLIELEWSLGSASRDRRLFIEIGDAFIRTMR